MQFFLLSNCQSTVFLQITLKFLLYYICTLTKINHVYVHEFLFIVSLLYFINVFLLTLSVNIVLQCLLEANRVSLLILLFSKNLFFQIIVYRWLSEVLLLISTMEKLTEHQPEMPEKQIPYLVIILMLYHRVLLFKYVLTSSIEHWTLLVRK